MGMKDTRGRWNLRFGIQPARKVKGRFWTWNIKSNLSATNARRRSSESRIIGIYSYFLIPSQPPHLSLSPSPKLHLNSLTSPKITPSYFNLNPTINNSSSEPQTLTSHTITLPTNLHLPLDHNSIPTGAITPHPSLPSPPSSPLTLGPTSPRFDDCIVLDPPPPPSSTGNDENKNGIPLDTRLRPLRPLIHISHPTTKLHLEIFSTEPAFQLYTGEGIDVPEVRDGKGQIVQAALGPRSGIAVEPSRYVDAQREEWRVGQCLLKRGQMWGARSRYVAWKERGEVR